MALVKVKPTSPGRRAVVKVINPDLHKGAPYAKLVEKQTHTAGRNNNGHITTRHIGGGHKQHYRIVDFRRNKDGIAARMNGWNMILIVAQIWRCYVMPMASGATLSRRRALSPGCN